MMATALRRRCMIQLMDKTVSTSKTGFQTRNADTGREVYAEVGGVSRSEFYKAAAAGMAPSAAFSVSEADYRDERLLKHGEKLYRVIRTYPLPNRRIELVCQGESPNDD